MPEQLANLPERPETPFLEGYPEWNNLIADDMETSPDARADHDPAAEMKRTLSAIYGFDNTLNHPDPELPDFQPEEAAYDRAWYSEEDGEDAAYERFTAGQSEAAKLPEEKFEYLRSRVTRAFPEARDRRNMQYFLLGSDALKNPKIMHDMGWDHLTDSHDLALAALFTDPAYEEQRKRHFPSFDSDKFTDQDRSDIRDWASLMTFNMPGWAQSQSNVAHLRPFIESPVSPKLKEQFLWHGIFDVMGAMGNKNLTGALTYTEKTHDMMMDVVDALTVNPEELAAKTGIPTAFESLNLPEADKEVATRQFYYLALRAKYYGAPLNKEGAAPRVEESLDIPKEIDDAGLRALVLKGAKNHALSKLQAEVSLSNMCRFDREAFAALRQAYNYGHSNNLNILTRVLAKGNMEVDYGPSMVRQLLGSPQDFGSTEKLHGKLRDLQTVFGRIDQATNDYYHEGMMSGRPIEGTNITVLCKELTKKLGAEPRALDGDWDIAVERQGAKLIPRLVTIDAAQ